MSTARVRLPLLWLLHFSNQHLVTWPRVFLVRPPADEKIVVAFDASTSGGGAWLTWGAQGQVGTSHFLHVTWTLEDERVLSARRGDPAFQATWEIYALLIAISTWQNLLASKHGPLQLQGDAQGVLQAVLQRRARAPTINFIIAEIQLLLGPSMMDLFAAHFWSEENWCADALSRISEGAQIPESLKDFKRWSPRRRCWKFVGKHRS